MLTTSPEIIKARESKPDSWFTESRNELAVLLARGVLGADTNFGKWPLQKGEESTTQPNRWSIYDMHGGVAEWAVESLRDWDDLYHGKVIADDESRFWTEVPPSMIKSLGKSNGHLHITNGSLSRFGEE